MLGQGRTFDCPVDGRIGGQRIDGQRDLSTWLKQCLRELGSAYVG